MAQYRELRRKREAISNMHDVSATWASGSAAPACQHHAMHRSQLTNAHDRDVGGREKRDACRTIAWVSTRHRIASA
eukprot:2144693-Rhodomonas_salina.4